MKAKFLIPLVCCIMLTLHESQAEPSCSRFHYEEQTLNKLVRLEFAVEQSLKETQTALKEMRQELADVRKERDSLRSEMDISKSEYIQKMDNMSTWRKSVVADLVGFKDNINLGIKDDRKIPMIWFMAKGPTDKSPAKNQIIIYGTVVTNEGNGYDRNTGKFTAPLHGLYAFTYHACALATQGWHYAFMRNDMVLLSGRDYESDNGYPCSSATVYSALDQYDVVYIKVWYGGGHDQIHTTDPNFMNTFSGILIHT